MQTRIIFLLLTILIIACSRDDGGNIAQRFLTDKAILTGNDLVLKRKAHEYFAPGKRFKNLKGSVGWISHDESSEPFLDLIDTVISGIGILATVDWENEEPLNKIIWQSSGPSFSDGKEVGNTPADTISMTGKIIKSNITLANGDQMKKLSTLMHSKRPFSKMLLITISVKLTKPAKRLSLMRD